MKKDIETILENSGQIDKKHKLNTCPNQIIKDKILNELETSGATLERLDELNKTIDIFRYKTQITIHGIFSELLNNRIGSYKNIFQNKNKSIGVKWEAIDYDKKKNIYSKLEYFDFSTIHNSKEFAAVKTFRVFTKDEYNEKLRELKVIEQRIDKTLFFGYCGIYTYKDWGVVYLQLVVSINAIYNKNINKLIEQITGISIQEVEQIKAAKEAETKKYWEDYKEKIRIEKEQDEKNEQDFINNNKIEGSEQVQRYDLQEGDIILNVRERKNELYWSFKIVQKIKRTLFKVDYDFEKMEAINTHSKSKIRAGSKYSGLIIKKPIEMQTIKDVAKVDVTAKKEHKIETIKGLQLVDYSEKAIAVIGETKNYKDTLKSLGGRFNFNLTCGAGWIFPKSKANEIKNKLNLTL